MKTPSLFGLTLFVSVASVPAWSQDAVPADPAPAPVAETGPKEGVTPPAETAPPVSQDNELWEFFSLTFESAKTDRNAVRAFLALDEPKPGLKKDKKDDAGSPEADAVKAEVFLEKATALTEKTTAFRALPAGSLNEYSQTLVSRLERLRDCYRNYGTPTAPGSAMERLLAFIDVVAEMQLSLPAQARSFLYVPTYQVKGKNGKVLSVEILKMDSQFFFGRVNNSPTYSNYKWDVLDLPWLETGCPPLHQAYEGVKGAEKTDYNQTFEEFVEIFRPRMDELSHSLEKFYHSEHKALGYQIDVAQGDPTTYFLENYLETLLTLSFYNSLDKSQLNPRTTALLRDVENLSKVFLARHRNFSLKGDEAKLKDISSALEKFLTNSAK